MKRNVVLTITILTAILWGTISYADDIPVIAAASDLNYVMTKVSDKFTADTGHRVRLSFGSSGSLKRLIKQGAPYEIFLSADENYIFQLEKQGYTVDQGHIYAIGRLALFAPHGSALEQKLDLAELPNMLTDRRVHKFSIANPQHAPYGRAAREVLMNLKLWTEIKHYLVLGESASQATLFATSGATQGSLIPHTLALTPAIAEQGSFRLIDEELHSPLRQRMVRLKNAGVTAQLFYSFLQTIAARNIFHHHGFMLPHES